MEVKIELGPEFKRQFKRLAKNVMVSEDGLNVTLLTIYDKGEISNVKDEFIEFLIKNL